MKSRKDTYIPITYSGFYDAPLAFLVEYQNKMYLFWRGYFDEEIDNFPSDYEVFSVDPQSTEDTIDWNALIELKKVHIGRIPMEKITFDSTKRESIEKKVFEILTSKNQTD